MPVVDTQLIAKAEIGGKGGVTPLPEVSSAVEQHTKIKEALLQSDKCLTILELVDLTNLEEDVVKDHLKVMELNKFGVFSSEDGEFCSFDVLKKMKTDLDKLAEGENEVVK